MTRTSFAWAGAIGGAVLVFASANGCSSNTVITAPSTKADSGVATTNDDAGSGDDASTGSCAATCTTPSDCESALHGKAGCWSCTAGCCVGVTAGTDPQKACASAETACIQSSCDGKGACATKNAPVGTPCGHVCSGFGYVYDGTCGGSGAAASTCDAVTTTAVLCGTNYDCAGSTDECAQCPASGCTATCVSILGGSPSRTCP